MHSVVLLLVCVCAAIATQSLMVHRREVPKESDIDTHPEQFEPPPYYKYLHDTDETIATIVKHFHPKAFSDIEDEDFRYIVLTSTTYALVDEVILHGGQQYDNNYDDLVREHMDHAMLNTYDAAKHLYCNVLVHVVDAVKKVREVIENSYVQYICRVQPDSCNSVIWAIVHYNHDKDADQSAKWLESIGPASEIFVNEYAKSFEAVSALNVYRYIFEAKDDLRSLVIANVLALRKIPRVPQYGCHLNSTKYDMASQASSNGYPTRKDMV